MSKQKYLILGGNGLVGKNLAKILRAQGEDVVVTSRKPEGLENALACDILNEDDLTRVFEQTQPDVVINATNLAGGVDFCEHNPDKSEAFHLNANINIGNLCKKHGSKMVLISTDYVFDGENPPYSEDDATNPLNNYGKFKLEAEQWMEQNLDNYLIVRTTNVFGWDPLSPTPNFLIGTFRRWQDGEETTVPSFLLGNPTHAYNLSEGILSLIDKAQDGLFHVVGSSLANRLEWVQGFASRLNRDDIVIKENPTPPEGMIPRPLESDLKIDKFKSVSPVELWSMDRGIDFFIEEMKQDLG